MKMKSLHCSHLGPKSVQVWRKGIDNAAAESLSVRWNREALTGTPQQSGSWVYTCPCRVLLRGAMLLGQRRSLCRRVSSSWKTTLARLLLAPVLMVFAGCGSSGDPTEPAPPPDPGNDSVQEEAGLQLDISDKPGRTTFASPHTNPIVVNGSYVYVANTPADTVDVIDTRTNTIAIRINVGVDPVSLAVRPDGNEIWVANHVSDSISVIDSDFRSTTFQQVIGTIQAIDDEVRTTTFDEPVGIAFANNNKAYAALSVANEIAVINVSTREVTRRLNINAQEPRAITVRDGRLYVISFESNNQTQLSGCREENIDGELCTFDAVQHVFLNNNVLSLGYEADIVKHSDLPDRDLFVYETNGDLLIDTVEDVGTLLYGVTVDSGGRVYVAQADARNEANGNAGTEGDGLEEMENRAFFNQITWVDCAGTSCGTPRRWDLEPRPPNHPEAGLALATPFAIAVSEDDDTLVVTAASSNKVFTVNANTGEVLGRTDVDAVPRGIALVSDDDGAPDQAWVLNAVENTVSLVDLKDVANPSVSRTFDLDDPTPANIKSGRMAFHDANMSSTGTFSCDSCHPDNHTDQIAWVLDTPQCDVEGCDQIMPRVTMPARGLRDTAPYHWDGIPGDPFGGINTSSLNEEVDPNCDEGDEESCVRHLVDGSQETTMCDQSDCPTNDEGLPGLMDAAERDALTKYLLAVPYPPAPGRSFDDRITEEAADGFFEFSFINDTGRTTGAQTCGGCHKMPFLVSTNTPGSGMDAPTWRGAYERWMLLPQGRLNIHDLLEIVDMDDTFPERDMWTLGGASDDIWEMVLQQSTGHSGSFARQTTLNDDTANDSLTDDLLDQLEESASDGAVLLQAEGVEIDADSVTEIALEWTNGTYESRISADTYSRSELISMASAGELILTITARAPANIQSDSSQPAIWPVAPIHAQTRTVELATLSDSFTLRINGRHVEAGSAVYMNGARVEGSVSCESGAFPNCTDETLIVKLDEAPADGGIHFLQLQNPEGLFSNDMMIWSEQNPLPARTGNLIASGGAFNFGQGQFDDNWNAVEIVTNSIEEIGGEVRIDLREAGDFPWFAQISHAIMVVGGQEYTLCYDAKADASRYITAYTDTNMDNWVNTSGGQFRADLTTDYQTFQHTFTIEQTDLHGRVAFDFAQSATNVQIDNIGVYEGSECGSP